MRMSSVQFEAYKAKQNAAPVVMLKEHAIGATEFSAFCPGNPTTQGSSRAFLTNLNAVRAGAKPIIVITSDNPALKKWRKAMADCFRAEAEAQGLTQPLDGPLISQYVFIMPRLAGHPKTKDGNRWPWKGLDLDKLIRAANDALVDAGVVQDDSRPCIYDRPMKQYASLTETPGVLVRVWRLGVAE
jgi:Holliday junction resolvase RusA-like endonuclease